MKFDSSNLNNLIRESDNKNLVLPNFQRDFVWSVDKQKTLLASFLLNLPTGSLLTVAGKETDFAAREVCFPRKIQPSSSCTYLLDGQQRLSSLKNIFTNLYNQKKPECWREIWNPLFKKLQYRYYLNVNNDSSDLFGFRRLNFDQSKFEDNDPTFLVESISTKPILVKDVDKYFHPGFIPTNAQGEPLPDSKRKAAIVSGYSEELLIPLYEIYNSTNNSLHVKVLRMISSKRAQEMETELEGDNSEIIQVLEPVEDNIAVYLDEGNNEAIRRAWVRLSETWTQNVQSFLESRLNIPISEISLDENEVGKAFAIFEIINQPGTPLDEYDLIVAKAARNVHLPQLTSRIISKLESKYDVPESITYHIKSPKPLLFDPINFNVISDKSPQSDFKVRFLQMLSIISYCIEGEDELNINHLKRDKFLGLNEDQINGNYETALTALLRAYMFLHFRCGVVSIDKVPYKLMAVPIAFQFLKDEVWNNRRSIDKIEYWYWSSLFSGYYKMNQNQKSFDDIQNLENFLKGKEPKVFSSREKKIFKDEGYSDKNTLMFKSDEKIQLSIQSAILQYILSQQPRDFIDEEKEIYLSTWDIANRSKFMFNGKLEELKIEDHHICPLSNASSLKESSFELRKKKRFILNSPLNRTFISKYSNRTIGTFRPEDYFKFVSESAKHGHLIPMPIDKKYLKQNGEENNTYYERVVGERFDELEVKIKGELLSLL